MTIDAFPVAQARALTQSRTWEVLCHLPSFTGWAFPFGNIFGPLVVWLLKHAESPDIDHHGKEAMNFQLSVTLYLLLLVPFCFVLIGIPFVIMLVVLDVVLTIVAAVKASTGQPYRYPLTIRFIR